MLALVEKRTVFGLNAVLMIFCCISISKSAEFTASLSGPVMIQWSNLNYKGQGLTGSGRTQKLIVFGTISSEYHLRKIDELPQQYTIQNQCTVLPSSKSVPIYAFHQYEFNAEYSFIHLHDSTVIEEGTLYVSSHQQTEKIQRVFQISVKRQKAQNQAPNSIFFQYENILYELESLYYSKQPKCYFLSHLITSMICEQGCTVKSIKDVVENDNLPVKAHYLTYQKHFQSLFLPKVRQFSNELWFPQIKITQQDGLSDFIEKKLVIQANSTEVKAQIIKITDEYYSLTINIVNLKADFTLTQLQVQADGKGQKKKVLLYPWENKQILMSVSQAESIKVVIYNDLKNGVIINPQIKSLQNNGRQPQNNPSDQTKIQQIEANATLGIVIGAIGGFIGFILVACCSTFIYRYVRNRKKQGVQQQVQNTKDSQNNNQTFKNSQKKNVKPQIAFENSIDKRIQAQDSRRVMNPQENELQQDWHNIGAKREYSIDQKIQEISMKSDKNSTGKTRPNTLQSLEEQLPPQIQKSLGEKK